MAVTSVSASLILTGRLRTHPAAEVTRVLGIEPTRAWEIGDPHQSRSLAAKGAVTTYSRWCYVEPRTIADEEDPHGMESLVKLAERLEPLAPKLAELAPHFEIVVTMFGMSDSAQGGSYIGPETMRRLGLLGAGFVQDFYLTGIYTEEEVAEWAQLPTLR